MQSWRSKVILGLPLTSSKPKPMIFTNPTYHLASTLQFEIQYEIANIEYLNNKKLLSTSFAKLPTHSNRCDDEDVKILKIIIIEGFVNALHPFWMRRVLALASIYNINLVRFVHIRGLSTKWKLATVLFGIFIDFPGFSHARKFTFSCHKPPLFFASLPTRCRGSRRHAIFNSIRSRNDRRTFVFYTALSPPLCNPAVSFFSLSSENIVWHAVTRTQKIRNQFSFSFTT